MPVSGDQPIAPNWACLAYELTRELLLEPAQRLQSRLKQQQEFERKLRDDDTPVRDLHPPDIPLLITRVLELMPESPKSAPFLALPQQLQQALAERFPEPASKPTLQPPDDDDIEWLAGKTGDEWQIQLEKLHLVAFQIPRGLSRGELLARFDRWITLHPEIVTEQKSGRNKRRWDPYELLRGLAIKRLAKAVAGYTKLAELAARDLAVGSFLSGREERLDPASLQRKARIWDRALEAWLDGTLRDFRTEA